MTGALWAALAASCQWHPALLYQGESLMGFAVNGMMILADVEAFEIIVLVVIALFSIVGKWAKGKKDKESEQALQLQSNQDEEELVDIDLADFLIGNAAAPPPVARPLVPAVASVPAPTAHRPAISTVPRRHPPAPVTPHIQAVPASPVRIVQRSKARPNSVEPPTHLVEDRWAEKPQSGPSPDGIELGIRALLHMDPASLRRAIVVSEILSQPVALRDGTDSDRDIRGAI